MKCFKVYYNHFWGNPISWKIEMNNKLFIYILFYFSLVEYSILPQLFQNRLPSPPALYPFIFPVLCNSLHVPFPAFYKYPNYYNLLIVTTACFAHDCFVCYTLSPSFYFFFKFSFSSSRAFLTVFGSGSILFLNILLYVLMLIFINWI